MRMKVDTSGFTELSRELTSASRKVHRKAKGIVKRTAMGIERDAKIGAPVDTGALRGSISTDLTETATAIQTETGPTVEYGGYVEEGTSRMSGQPYMRPATDRRLPAMYAAFDKIAEDL